MFGGRQIIHNPSTTIPLPTLSRMYLLISCFLNQAFPIKNSPSIHNPINSFPLLFLPGTQYFPITSISDSFPTLAFKSTNATTLSFSLKVPRHSFNLPQNNSFSSSLLSLPAPYILTNTHFSTPS